MLIEKYYFGDVEIKTHILYSADLFKANLATCFHGPGHPGHPGDPVVSVLRVWSLPVHSHHGYRQSGQS